MKTAGVRVYPNDQGVMNMPPNSYGRDANGTWMVRPPGCHAGGIPEHEVTEHEDGTITVSPSILLDEPGVGKWHGHLRRGVFEGC